VRTWDYSFPYVLIYFHLSSHLHFSSRRSFIFLSNCDYGVFWWVALVIIGGTFILCIVVVLMIDHIPVLKRFIYGYRGLSLNKVEQLLKELHPHLDLESSARDLHRPGADR
jgi:hypothetical protein